MDALGGVGERAVMEAHAHPLHGAHRKLAESGLTHLNTGADLQAMRASGYLEARAPWLILAYLLSSGVLFDDPLQTPNRWRQPCILHPSAGASTSDAPSSPTPPHSLAGKSMQTRSTIRVRLALVVGLARP